MAQEEIRSTTALIALDESEESASALQWALERMLKPGDTIVLLHSQQIPYMYMVEPAPFGMAQSPELIIAFRKQQKEAGRAILERGKKLCQEHQLTVKTVIKEGDPRENICETVTEVGADLLIMGSRGRGALKRALLGSVSDYCAHNVNCPLLILPPSVGLLHWKIRVMAGDDGSNDAPSPEENGNSRVRGLIVKAVCLIGGTFLIRKLTKTKTRWDHAHVVADALTGEKSSEEQAARDPMTYFNLRVMTCPATILADGARVLYFEQAFWRTSERPYRQRFFVVRPCHKDMKCDVEVASHAVRDIEEYRHFCDRPKTQRPQPEEIARDVAEHLTSIYLSRCDRNRRCLYEGSTPPGGYPNNWNGATQCTSEMSIYKNGEVHSWDRAYDDEGNQVWGVREGPYEYKSVRRPFVDLDYTQPVDKTITIAQ